MNKLVDKLIIIIFCFTLYIPNVYNLYMIIPILIAITFSATLSYLENDRIIIGIFVIYSIICFFEPTFLFFLPLICYDVLLLKNKWIWVVAAPPFIANINEMLSFSRVSIPIFILVAYFLKYRTISLENMKEEFFKLRDNTKEISLKLENKNKELIGKQDYEINLATLKERNRIARDIHDNVGHLLTRSILQIGALLALNREKETKENLTSIKATLSEAMDSIRSSVHDLHEESIDLHIELQTLINNFKFCLVKFDYDARSNLEKNLKYCFIAVTKEALSNIINHSNATMVSIIIREHPALYQLVIHDNGTESNYNSENGIGIKNIKDRVTGVGGNVNISWDKGFRIFISIPKS